MHTSPRVALVTGATQGLGLALVRGLSARLTPTDLVLLTSRDPQRVAAAAPGAAVGPAPVRGVPLDVDDEEAIRRLAEELVREHGGVDYVFSNATARHSPDRPAAEQIDAVVRTSNRATSLVLRHLLPQVRPGGALVVVASSLGVLGHLPPAVRDRFAGAATLDAVDEQVERWRREVLDGTALAHGWPGWINIPAKVAQVAAVRAVASDRRARDLAEDRLLVSVCPGLLDTDASRPWFPDMSRAATPDQGAQGILDLALRRPVDPAIYGELVRYGQVVPWDGPVAPLPAALADGRGARG